MSQTNILLESGTNELEIVEFLIEEQGEDGEVYTGHYGVNVAKVLEIIRKPEITQLPDSDHPSVMGAYELRDRVVPLIDLSRWLGKKMTPTETAKVIVTEFNRTVNSFMVSGVTRIHRIGWSEVEPPSQNLMRYSKDSITGVVKFDDRLVFLLDMEKIAADLNPELGLNYKEDQENRELSPEDTLKIFFADDSSMVRKTMTSGFEKEGYEVQSAGNGREAWDKLLEIKKWAEDQEQDISEFLHVIISDIEMPVMDGHNLTKRIKDDPVLQKLPVILFSSLITDTLRHKGESVGADEQISKPEIGTLISVSKRLAEEKLGKRIQ